LTRYASNYVDVFDHPKILYPEISKGSRFGFDANDFYYPNKTVYSIPTTDFYLLGILNSAFIQNWFLENLTILQGGYRLFSKEIIEKLPIPSAPQSEHNTVAKLTEEAQKLHTQRRKRVEKFLREIGIEPAQSTSRSPLEQVWSLTAEEFTRRVGRSELIPTYKSAHEETMSVTEEIVRVEKEIDERVKGLYGV
jgi:hypothetical protein